MSTRRWFAAAVFVFLFAAGFAGGPAVAADTGPPPGPVVTLGPGETHHVLRQCHRSGVWIVQVSVGLADGPFTLRMAKSGRRHRIISSDPGQSAVARWGTRGCVDITATNATNRTVRLLFDHSWELLGPAGQPGRPK